MANTLLLIVCTTTFAFVLNLPFGYLRSKSKRYSIAWLLYIHLPVPFIFVARNWADLSYAVVPVILIGAVAGQLLGGRIKPQKASS